MKEENAIEVRNLKKSFKVYLDKSNSLKEKVIFRNRNRYEERTVLKGVSFDIKKGEAVGLVGHNGCGKSTTLKLLTRIIYPDEGSVELKGRVSSLLELGAGFHPDMSGRENIYINASIFGLSRKEIDARIDDIIDFSELGEYIDNPVRTYSSGMYMRLAFSVAINVNADILLIDEILAVGDVNFQSKCFSKLREIKQSGTTIVIVSHSMEQIEKICSRCIWINNGEKVMDGRPRDVDNAYLTYMSEQQRQKQFEKHKNSVDDNNEIYKRRGTGEVRITDVKCINERGQEASYIKYSESIIFEISYKVIEPVEKALFGLCIISEDGTRCFGSNSLIASEQCKDLRKDGKVKIKLRNTRFIKGLYSVDATVENFERSTIDYYDNCTKFKAESERIIDGLCWVEHEWDMLNY